MEEMETRFLRPAEPLLSHLVARALTAAGERAGPGEWTWVEHGSATVVVLTEAVAVRVARQPETSAQLRRTQRLVDALPPLPFEVPRSAGEPVEVDGLVAVATERLRGEPTQPPDLDLRALSEVLEAVRGVDVEPLRPWLAEWRAFSGGGCWQQVMREGVVPRLAADLRVEADRRIQMLARLQAPERALAHGDLGRSNVLWRDGRIVAVLDWDLATLDDPAEDVATVALSFDVWDRLPELADAGTARRADVLRLSYPLQIVAHAVLRRRPQDEVERTVARAERAMRRG